MIRLKLFHSRILTRRHTVCAALCCPVRIRGKVAMFRPPEGTNAAGLADGLSEPMNIAHISVSCIHVPYIE